MRESVDVPVGNDRSELGHTHCCCFVCSIERSSEQASVRSGDVEERQSRGSEDRGRISVKSSRSLSSEAADYRLTYSLN